MMKLRLSTCGGDCAGIVAGDDDDDDDADGDDDVAVVAASGTASGAAAAAKETGAVAIERWPVNCSKHTIPL